MLLAAGAGRDVAFDFGALLGAELPIQVREDHAVDVATARVEPSSPNPATNGGLGHAESAGSAQHPRSRDRPTVATSARRCSTLMSRRRLRAGLGAVACNLAHADLV